jgi:alpha-mannosidase
MNAFSATDTSSLGAARAITRKVLGERWEASGARIYDVGPEKPLIWGIGHCHIDSAWLWPYSVTQQKVARSWATQVDLMERYEEHRFAASSAQQYKWLEQVRLALHSSARSVLTRKGQLYPKLFEKVQAKIAAGRFHLVGGSWVENDANMPSGEALVRQFLYGQRYFASRFGKRCETGWLPDSFGLTGAYPQLMRQAGMKYFFTQKLSW